MRPNVISPESNRPASLAFVGRHDKCLRNHLEPSLDGYAQYCSTRCDQTRHPILIDPQIQLSSSSPSKSLSTVPSLISATVSARGCAALIVSWSPDAACALPCEPSPSALVSTFPTTMPPATPAAVVIAEAKKPPPGAALGGTGDAPWMPDGASAGTLLPGVPAEATAGPPFPGAEGPEADAELVTGVGDDGCRSDRPALPNKLERKPLLTGVVLALCSSPSSC